MRLRTLLLLPFACFFLFASAQDRPEPPKKKLSYLVRKYNRAEYDSIYAKPPVPSLFKPTQFYLAPGIELGNFLSPTLGVGAYVHNVNIEAAASIGFSKIDVWALPFPDVIYYDPEHGTLRPIVFGLKVGYGLRIDKRWRVTPRVCGMIARAKAEGILTAATGSIGLDVRVEYYLNRHISAYCSPQARWAVEKGENYYELTQLASKADSWGTAYGAILGVSFNF